ncbi:hypothetical protein GCM10028792_18790 [Salinisphaera aquimarina]
MSGMDGIALQRELIKLNSPIRVIILSAFGSIEQAVTAMRLGAADFIEQPVLPEQLLIRTQELLKAEEDADLVRQKFAKRTVLVETLTFREKQVFTLIVEGLCNRQIGDALNISHRTVETHRERVMQKLHAKSVPDLVRMWFVANSHMRLTA